MELPQNLIYHTYHGRLSLIAGERFGGAAPVERLLGELKADGEELYELSEIYELDHGRDALLRAITSAPGAVKLPPRWTFPARAATPWPSSDMLPGLG